MILLQKQKSLMPVLNKNHILICKINNKKIISSAKVSKNFSIPSLKINSQSLNRKSKIFPLLVKLNCFLVLF